MKKLISGAAIAAALAVASSANAADIARPVYKAPVMVQVYNWTGFYIGGNAGWYELDTNMSSTPGNAATTAFNTACIVANACPQNYGSSSSSGFIGGLQAGYNWQVNNFVLGVETDFAWTSKSASAALNTQAPGFLPFAGSNNTNQDWLGTVRGRAGMLFTPELLGYATGGFAYAKVNRTWNAAFPASSSWSGSNSETLTGWTIGGGIEWALGNGWSLGAEYLYVRLGGGDSFLTNVQGGACNGTNCTFVVTPEDVTENIVRAKLNYKFGYSKAPVVAKY